MTNNQPDATDFNVESIIDLDEAKENKIPISVRLNTEVIDYFKRGGPGYQSRINAVLLAYVRAQQKQKRE